MSGGNSRNCIAAFAVTLIILYSLSWLLFPFFVIYFSHLLRHAACIQSDWVSFTKLKDETRCEENDLRI